MNTSKVSTTSAYTVRDQQRMSQAVNYFLWQARLAMQPLGQRVVEVGCGIGNFTRMISDRQMVIGIDVDPACVAEHQKRFAGQENIKTKHLNVLDPAFQELREHEPESVVCLNVLEHIEDDLGTLKAFSSILPDRGIAVLMVPAFMSLYGPIDKNLGHYRRYTLDSFEETANAAGFVAKELRYMNLVGFFGWWVNAKLLKREEQSEGQIGLFDKAIVPYLEKFESIVTPPFGQSVFAVIEKRQGMVA